MNYLVIPLLASLITASLSSCGAVDPAEKLATYIKVNAKKLKKSPHEAMVFQFIPDRSQTAKVTNYDHEVMVRTVNPKSGRSVIAICEWYTTTYHTRFVKTPKELKAVKCLGEPFLITLEKSGDTVNWVDLK